jgi:hypothetical protein
MKHLRYSLLFLLLPLAMSAQVKEDSLGQRENDTAISKMIDLQEIVLYKDNTDPEARKAWLLLQSRVYKVYPFAKIASERLTLLDRNMGKLKTEREKKKYFKIVEDYIENEFTDRLKKLSRKQGQILVKLIYRQTGRTTYDLIKDYKSGWKAFWASNTARIFDIDLKRGYAPFEVNEDYLIETILVRAFANGRLVRQDAANPIDYSQLDAYWVKRVTEEREKAKERAEK